MTDETALRERLQELQVQEGQIHSAARSVREKIDAINSDMWAIKGRLPVLVAERKKIEAPLLDIKKEQTEIIKRMKGSVRGAEIKRI